MTYQPAPERYRGMSYGRCGASGLKLPPLTLGFWQNFGDSTPLDSSRAMVRYAFDRGINHFDLANNYGPPPGAAEQNFGRILRADFAGHRDEMIIATKAGYDMWPGPYGQRNSTRKYLLSSLDQSLTRLGLDYVDIFYSHRFDPQTPLFETMGALDQAVRSGRALYAGISSYSPKKTKEAAAILRELGTPCLIHQPSYSLLNRWVEGGLLDTLEEEGIRCIAFSPLAQGMLSGKYLDGVPEGTRGAEAGSLKPEYLSDENPERIRALNALARGRGQTLAQMAIAWVLRDRRVTTALIGARTPAQIEENLGALEKQKFSPEELAAIDKYAVDSGINLWAKSHQDG